MRSFVFTIVMLLSLTGIAQGPLLDSAALATAETYTDLAQATSNPEAVIKLVLRKKKLRGFPREILRMKNLQYLDLSRNKITELNDSILLLKNLQYLIVSNTGLEKLPAGIGQLVNLVHLNVNQNEISSLPASIGKLENLEEADLWSNNLDDFPETMEGMKKLKWMDLRNILIPQNHQDRIQEMLPHAKIHFSPACKCAW